MDLATVTGIVVAFGAVALAAAIGGVDLSILAQRYEALILVLGGTIGATMVAFPMRVFVRGTLTGFRMAFVEVDYHEADVIALLVEYADKARRYGLLVLEEDVAQLEDDFLRRGLQLVIDGRDTAIVRKILETEALLVHDRNAKAESIFTTMGGYSPTLGIIGTVLGLIAMLKGLSNASGPGAANLSGAIGTATAQAFVATFFGILLANLVWLPIAAKIRARNSQLLLLREVMIEGILSIHGGDNPRLLEEKLAAFYDRDELAGDPVHDETLGEPTLARA